MTSAPFWQKQEMALKTDLDEIGERVTLLETQVQERVGNLEGTVRSLRASMEDAALDPSPTPFELVPGVIYLPIGCQGLRNGPSSSNWASPT